MFAYKTVSACIWLYAFWFARSSVALGRVRPHGEVGWGRGRGGGGVEALGALGMVRTPNWRLAPRLFQILPSIQDLPTPMLYPVSGCFELSSRETKRKTNLVCIYPLSGCFFRDVPPRLEPQDPGRRRHLCGRLARGILAHEMARPAETSPGEL